MDQTVFFQCRCKGSTDFHLGAADILKAHTHAATIPDLALVKPTFFSTFRCPLELFLLLLMVFHRRSKRVKIFF